MRRLSCCSEPISKQATEFADLVAFGLARAEYGDEFGVAGERLLVSP